MSHLRAGQCHRQHDEPNAQTRHKWGDAHLCKKLGQTLRGRCILFHWEQPYTGMGQGAGHDEVGGQAHDEDNDERSQVAAAKPR